MAKDKPAIYLFAAALLVALLQVWWPQYYVTGDGPCHVYNAQTLKELWVGHDADFYTQFYNLNTHPDPNWISHILLAILQLVCNGIVAEKILISMYLVLAAWAFNKLSTKNGNGCVK